MSIKQVPRRKRSSREAEPEVALPQDLVDPPGPQRRRLDVTPEKVSGAVPQLAAAGAGLGVSAMSAAAEDGLVLGVDPLAPVVAEALAEQILPVTPEVEKQAGVTAAQQDRLVGQWDGMVDLHQSAQQLQQDLSDSRDTVAMVQRNEREGVTAVVQKVLEPGSKLRAEVRAELEADWAPVQAKLDQLAAARKARQAHGKQQAQAGQVQQTAASKQAALLQTMIDLRNNVPVAPDRIGQAAQIYGEQEDEDLLAAGGVAPAAPTGAGPAATGGSKKVRTDKAKMSGGATATAGTAAAERRKKSRG